MPGQQQPQQQLPESPTEPFRGMSSETSINHLFTRLAEPSKPSESTPASPFAVKFADAFVFFLLAIFSFPIAAFTFLGFQSHIAYWIGRYCLLIWIIPPVLVCGYICLARQSYRRGVIVSLCIVIPFSICFFMSNFYYHRATSLTAQFLSDDCNTFAEKKNLNQAWLTAEKLWADCVNATMKGSGVNRTEAERIVRVHHCDGYEEGYKEWGASWDYLAHLEEYHHCTGWCNSGPQLWTWLFGKDRCSLAVGMSMELALRRVAMQVFAVSGVILLVVVLAIIMDPFAKLGIKW